MAEERLLTVRDVSIILGISEREVLNLAESGAIPSYKVGGVYLRFNRQQIDAFRKNFKPAIAKVAQERQHSFRDRFRDFLYFNDFYILAALIILIILFIIFKGY